LIKAAGFIIFQRCYCIYNSPSDEIPGEEWFRYFKSLNKNNKNVDSSFLNKLKDLENVKIFT
jgi:hypothetical protein